MLRRFLQLALIFSISISSNIYAKSVKLLGPVEISKLLNKKNTIILDVRTPTEYAQGHLNKSILINAYDPKFKEKIGKLIKSKTYIVYCHSGGRSHFASDYMLSIGFKDLIDMKGGITAWKNNGLKTIK